MTACFIFEGEILVCERIYFDALTLLQQWLAGVSWKKPASLWLVVKMLRGMRQGLR